MQVHYQELALLFMHQRGISLMFTAVSVTSTTAPIHNFQLSERKKKARRATNVYITAPAAKKKQYQLLKVVNDASLHQKN